MVHKLLIFIVLIVVILLGVSQYFVYQGDQAISKGDPETALPLYNRAKQIFPFRFDIEEKTRGAKLIQQSNLSYKQISEVDAEIENAEIQNIPSLSTLPSSRQLKQGEVVVPILMYHHIEANPRPYDPVYASLFVTPAQLDSQLQYLSSHNFNPISLDQLYQALNGNYVLPVNPVVLTFDDGYKSFYDNAFPLLKKYQFKAIEFVITNVTTYPAYLSWNQIIELDKSGLVEIGAHTRTHPSLNTLSKSGIDNEVKGSKSDIESHIGKTIHWFAYPYGTYNDLVISSVKDAGFTGAVSVIYSPVQSADKLYFLPRVMVDGRFSLDEFSKRLY